MQKKEIMPGMENEMKFTEAQVLFLEDRIINKLSPAYMNLDRILEGETLTPEMLRSSREALWEIKTIIRGLRNGTGPTGPTKASE
jgi:hypothetical protein